jgi:hypothetical protein
MCLTIKIDIKDKLNLKDSKNMSIHHLLTVCSKIMNITVARNCSMVNGTTHIDLCDN